MYQKGTFMKNFNPNRYAAINEKKTGNRHAPGKGLQLENTAFGVGGVVEHAE